MLFDITRGQFLVNCAQLLCLKPNLLIAFVVKKLSIFKGQIFTDISGLKKPKIAI